MNFWQRLLAGAAALLLALSSHSSPVHMDVGAGPRMTFDATTRVYSFSGAADARTGVSWPICASVNGWCISGYQTLTATINESGEIVDSAYSFVGVAPALGISTERVLLSASVRAIGLYPGNGSDAQFGSIWTNIVLTPIVVDDAVGDYVDGNLLLWGETYYPIFTNDNSALPYGMPLTADNMWDHSWGIARASDYSSIDEIPRRVPEPSSLLLSALALVFASGSVRRART